jgi:molybdopterin-guanine dinucleotide biosynthesis protein A
MHAEGEVTGVILAGGRATRLDGLDKGLISLQGRPLLEYVIQQLAPQVDALIINANRNLTRYAAYGYPVVSDRIPGYAGPLAGILTALQSIETRYLLCVPCDGPWLPPDLRVRLQAALQSAAAEICCVHDGKRLHPVFALLEQGLDNPLAAYLAQGGRVVQHWYASRRLVPVDFSDCAELFVNINTQEDLQRVTEHLAHPHN